jgi:hypothetical protein
MTSSRFQTALNIALCILSVGCCPQQQRQFGDREEFGTGMERCSFQKLEDQGFSGGLDQGTVIQFLGVIETEKTKFNAYYYEFNNPQNNHGNHRLLILDRKCNYLASYSVNDRPLFAYDSKVIFPAMEYPGNVVEFNGDKVPDHIWIHGDYTSPEYGKSASP